MNLIENQHLNPGVSGEASTEGLQVERTDASTVKVPNHGRSKQTVCTPPMEKLRKAEGSVYPMSLDTCIAFSPAAWRSRKGHSGPWRRGMAQGSTRATTYQVGLERTEQAYVAETW